MLEPRKTRRFRASLSTAQVSGQGAYAVGHIEQHLLRGPGHRLTRYALMPPVERRYGDSPPTGRVSNLAVSSSVPDVGWDRRLAITAGGRESGDVPMAIRDLLHPPYPP
jgi:hypothetical protein